LVTDPTHFCDWSLGASDPVGRPQVDRPVLLIDEVRTISSEAANLRIHGTAAEVSSYMIVTVVVPLGHGTDVASHVLAALVV